MTLQPGDETAAPGAITLPENWDDLELFFEPHAAASMAFGHMGGHDHIGGSAKRKSMTADKEKITMAGRCRLLLSNPVLKAHVVSALEATYNMMELLSNFGFRFKLRRYTMAAADGEEYDEFEEQYAYDEQIHMDLELEAGAYTRPLCSST